ncbi:MAG: hypothetical protein SFU99_02110, partial [Saprospiraceae bacterium]|nr:hypothetical protein [Saprospiraceae bacterium]
MLYQYKTAEFIKLIENLVAQGRTPKALEELWTALPRNNPLKREALHTFGIHKQITWRENMGFGMELENKN